MIMDNKYKKTFGRFYSSDDQIVNYQVDFYATKNVNKTKEQFNFAFFL